MNSIGGNLHNCRLPSFNLSYAYKKSKDNNLMQLFLLFQQYLRLDIAPIIRKAAKWGNDHVRNQI